MPDIDIDFPYNRREEVFKLIYKKWGDQIGRVSNHIHYHNSSATREGLKILGYRKMIPKYELQDFINRLSKSEVLELKNYVQEKDGTFKNYSLHCGGIVIFEKKIDKSIVLKTKTKNQLKYDKRDVENNGLLKLDILSNRGLAQLIDIEPNINIEKYKFDKNIIKLFSEGNNLGLTFSESITMKKALKLVKPKNIIELSKCLAIIRPAVSKNKFRPDAIIFDDDAIECIQDLINCKEEDADMYRKGFSNNKKDIIEKVELEVLNGSNDLNL